MIRCALALTTTDRAKVGVDNSLSDAARTFMARTHKTQKKVTVTKKHITCPHCDAELTVTTQMEFILMAGRTCPNCDKEFLIVNDLPMSVDQVRERLANKSHAVWRSHENSSWTRR